MTESLPSVPSTAASIRELARPPRVFISYAHDSDAHREQVRDLWVFLCAHGVDARIDRVAAEQRQDWTLWMEQQIAEADHVLIVASPAYKKRVGADPFEGQGVQFEARLIRNLFYQDQSALGRFLPVVLPGGSIDDLPEFLTPALSTVYRVSEFTVAGAEALLRVIHRRPGELQPEIGPVPYLPPRAHTVTPTTAETTGASAPLLAAPMLRDRVDAALAPTVGDPQESFRSYLREIFRGRGARLDEAVRRAQSNGSKLDSNSIGSLLRGSHHIRPEVAIELIQAVGASWDEERIAMMRYYQFGIESPSRGVVFLCHSSGDKERVRKLHLRLVTDSIRCWLDEDDLTPGQDWDLEIRKAIREARIVIACLSNSSTTKAGYIQKELRFALDRADEQPEGAIFLIPVRLEPCTVPDRLNHLQYVDLFEQDGYDKLLRTLRQV